MDYKKAEYKQSNNRFAGRTHKIREIAIHHWGSPTGGYYHNGVVSFLRTTKAQASAHYVVSAGRVTQLVREADTSWATNKANPWTISIEIDPKCELRVTKSQKERSDKIYETVAMLIRDIRRRHGNIPLVPHRKYRATACPGIISLKKLDKIAYGETTMLTKPRIKFLFKKYLGKTATESQIKQYTGKKETALLANMLVTLKKRNDKIRKALENERKKPPKEVFKTIEKIVEKEVIVERFPAWLPDNVKVLLERIFK